MAYNKILTDENLPMGRMLSYSKSAYRAAFPSSIVYFNANLITAKKGKFWWGDLDITIDAEALKTAAEKIGETIYVLTELEGRFENEEKDSTELMKKAVWDTTHETPFK